jgi:hypothetical protein
MLSSSSRRSFYHDPFSRRLMRLLLLLQPGAMVVVLWLCLTDRFVPALAISLLTLLVCFVVLAWVYARYQTLPVVREKRLLARLVQKFEAHLQVEELRIHAAIKERTRLNKAEKRELESALRTLQKTYMEQGLRDAWLEQAAVPGIGRTLKQQLAGYGILCAADVSDRIAHLPGFGVEKCHALLAWRSTVTAALESSKPSALPLEQADAIQQTYHALQDQNNAGERKAIASQQILEHELLSLKPRLHALYSITFVRYFSNALASRGIVAAAVTCMLVVTQIVSSVSATLAFGASDAAAAPSQAEMPSPTMSQTPAATNSPAPTAPSTK